MLLIKAQMIRSHWCHLTLILLIGFLIESCTSVSTSKIENQLLDSLMAHSSKSISSRRFREADSLLSLAKAKAIDTSDSTRLSNIYFNIGLVCYYTNDYDSGIEIYREAANLYAHLNDSNSTSQCYKMVALMYRKQGFTEKAIESFLSAIDHSTEPKDLAGALMSLGNLYKELKEFKNALSTYQKGLAIYESTNSEKNIAIAMNNLGITYHAMEDYNLAEDFYKEALNIRRKIQDSTALAPTVLNLGELYMDVGKLDSARIYLTSALQIPEYSAGKSVAIAAYNLLGKLHQQKKQYTTSKKHFALAHEALESYQSRRHSLDNYEGYKKLYTALGQFEEALFWDAKHDSLSAIFFEEERLKVHDKENQYKVNQEKRINAALEKERAFQKQLSELRLWVSLALGSILVMVVLQLVLLFAKNKKISKLNIKLEAQKETINILSKNNFHFTMNSLDELQGKFAYQANQMEGQSKETFNEVMSSLGTTARLFKNLLKTYDPSKEKTEDQDIKQFLEDVIMDSCSVHHLNSDRITRAIQIDHAKFKPKHMYSIGQMVNELVTNSAKYAFSDLTKNGRLEVHFIKKEHTILLSVKDDGTGISKQNTTKETSMGMSLVKILASSLDATCETTASPAGYETRIEIPYPQES